VDMSAHSKSELDFALRRMIAIPILAVPRVRDDPIV
jgi:hypothetical protein